MSNRKKKHTNWPFLCDMQICLIIGRHSGVILWVIIIDWHYWVIFSSHIGSHYYWLTLLSNDIVTHYHWLTDIIEWLLLFPCKMMSDYYASRMGGYGQWVTHEWLWGRESSQISWVTSFFYGPLRKNSFVQHRFFMVISKSKYLLQCWRYHKKSLWPFLSIRISRTHTYSQTVYKGCIRKDTKSRKIGYLHIRNKSKYFEVFYRILGAEIVFEIFKHGFFRIIFVLFYQLK